MQYKLAWSTIHTRWHQLPFWIKRVDACAQQAGDVQLIHNATEYAQALADFSKRNINQYVAEQHIEGDLIKFYGVEGTPFFHYSYPTEKAIFQSLAWSKLMALPCTMHLMLKA